MKRDAPTPQSPVDGWITVTIHHLVERLDRYADQRLRDRYGMTYSQFMFMADLACADPDRLPDVSEMARRLGVSKAAVSKRLHSFVTAGWVKSQSDSTNARRVVLSATPVGRSLVHQATADLDRCFTDLFEDLDDIDLDALHAQLKKIHEILDRKAI